MRNTYTVDSSTNPVRKVVQLIITRAPILAAVLVCLKYVYGSRHRSRKLWIINIITAEACTIMWGGFLKWAIPMAVIRFSDTERALGVRESLKGKRLSIKRRGFRFFAWINMQLRDPAPGLQPPCRPRAAASNEYYR